MLGHFKVMRGPIYTTRHARVGGFKKQEDYLKVVRCQELILAHLVLTAVQVKWHR